jgi:hypothetical protein
VDRGRQAAGITETLHVPRAATEDSGNFMDIEEKRRRENGKWEVRRVGHRVASWWGMSRPSSG